MKVGTRRLLTTAGFAAAGFGLAYVASKRTIRRKCKKQVRTECLNVPLLTEDFCNEQADKICDV